MHREPEDSRAVTHGSPEAKTLIQHTAQPNAPIQPIHGSPFPHPAQLAPQSQFTQQYAGLVPYAPQGQYAAQAQYMSANLYAAQGQYAPTPQNHFRQTMQDMPAMQPTTQSQLTHGNQQLPHVQFGHHMPIATQFAHTDQYAHGLQLLPPTQYSVPAQYAQQGHLTAQNQYLPQTQRAPQTHYSHVVQDVRSRSEATQRQVHGVDASSLNHTDGRQRLGRWSGNEEGQGIAGPGPSTMNHRRGQSPIQKALPGNRDSKLDDDA